MPVHACRASKRPVQGVVPVRIQIDHSPLWSVDICKSSLCLCNITFASHFLQKPQFEESSLTVVNEAGRFQKRSFIKNEKLSFIINNLFLRGFKNDRFVFRVFFVICKSKRPIYSKGAIVDAQKRPKPKLQLYEIGDHIKTSLCISSIFWFIHTLRFWTSRPKSFPCQSFFPLNLFQ